MSPQNTAPNITEEYINIKAERKSTPIKSAKYSAAAFSVLVILFSATGSVNAAVILNIKKTAVSLITGESATTSAIIILAAATVLPTADPAA